MNDYHHYWMASLAFFGATSAFALRSYDLLLAALIGTAYSIIFTEDLESLKMGIIFFLATPTVAFVGISYVRQIQRRLVYARMNLASAYEQLQQVDRMKDEFMSNAAHELRTPLAVIAALVEDIVVDRAADRYRLLISTIEKFRQQITEILQFNVDGLDSIIKRTPIQITEYMGDLAKTFAILADAEQVKLKILVKHNIVAKIDKDKFTTIISNLINNALKFTKSGGTISVVVNADQQGNLYVKVRDTGIGIPDNKIDRIFERYYQIENGLAKQGFGIGLTMVKQLVTAHDGTINVSSTVGFGTTFVIMIPSEARIIAGSRPVAFSSDNYSTAAVSPANSSSSLRAIDKDKPLVLVVEDNSMLRKSEVEWLIAADFEVVSFGSAIDALSFVNINKPQFTAIVSDVSLPGMDGYQFLTEIRDMAEYQKVPFIFSSGHSKASIMRRIKTSGVSAIEKPFNRFQFIEHVHFVVNISV